MEVTINIPDELAAEAHAHGMWVEMHAQELLARQNLTMAEEGHFLSVQAAIGRILELRKGNKLAGLPTKDLLYEGHKY